MKKNYTSFFTSIIFVIVFNYSNLFSQNSFGTVSSNYSPTNSVYLNPSSMMNSKTFLDINLFGKGRFVDNNLLFIPDDNYFNVYSLFKDIKSLDIKNDLYFDQSVLNKGKDIQLFSREFTAGPAFTCNMGKHAFGLSVNKRSYNGIENVPAFVGAFMQHGFSGFPRQQGKDYNVNDLRVVSLFFSEIKASYAYSFYQKGKNQLVGGISVKKFNSISGFAANVNNMAFNVKNDTLMSISNIDVDVLRTDSVKYRKGGSGFDLGFIYQKTLENCDSYLPHTPKSSCRYIPYKYKLGISLVDVGSVKFEEEKINYNGYNFKDIQFIGYSKFSSNPDSVVGIFQSQDDLKQGVVTKTNRILLPTFISAQFDYNVWGSAFYINTTVVQGVSHSKTKFGVRHANSISITPRFETRLIDFALPVSFYEYQVPQLGLNFRIGPITIGSDKFLNWVMNNDMYGGDIYFYLKAPIIYHPNCREMILKRKGRAGNFKSKINCAF